MKIIKSWNVNSGDLFELGSKTNENYCHAIPQNNDIIDMRISIIFRCVAKSFIDYNAPKIDVNYANGTIKTYSAFLITCKNIMDNGLREHISELINKRELIKKTKLLSININIQLPIKSDEIEGIRTPESIISSVDPNHASQTSGLNNNSLINDVIAHKLRDYYMGFAETVPIN